MKSKKIIYTLAFAILFLFGIAFYVFFIKNKNHEPIPIIISIDNEYTYPALVSMTSMLESAKTNTKYDISVLVPGDFSEQNKSKLQTLPQNYPNCTITFINMAGAFQDAPLEKHFTKAAYYRLAIPKIFPQYKKAIYMDVDTIILKDLTELYRQDIKQNYIGAVADEVRGRKEEMEEHRKDLDIPSLDQYINSGVLLWNLDLCRQDGITEKFSAFIEKHKNETIRCVDQSVINAVCYGKIFTLPFKYNAQTYLYTGKNYGEDQLSAKLATQSEWNEAWTPDDGDGTVIMHYAGSKPFNSKDVPFKDYWTKFAKMTPFREEIDEKYPIAFQS